MQTAEQADDCIKSGVCLSFIDPLESLLELIVAISGYEVRGHGTLIHKVLERYVSVLLELDVVAETFLHHDINFRFERQQGLSEDHWVLHEGLILNYLLTADLNIGLHLLNDVFQGALNATEQAVYEGELVEFRFLEHGVAAGVFFVYEVLGWLFNELQLDLIQEGDLGLRLKVKCCSLLFLQ